MAALDRKPDFDIVLMDIMMPVMDGYDTIRAIRASEQHRGLTVIAVTGKVMAGERKRCMDAGANDYVPKPVDLTELFAALRPWLPQTRKEAAVAGPPAVEMNLDRQIPDVIAGHTLDGLRILVVDDDYRNIFAMTAILERGNAVVTVAESGAEAIAALELEPNIDIVLMDIMMPVMDGYDTIRAIRKMSGFQVLPIVAVTGKAAAGERDDGKHLETAHLPDGAGSCRSRPSPGPIMMSISTMSMLGSSSSAAMASAPLSATVTTALPVPGSPSWRRCWGRRRPPRGCAGHEGVTSDDVRDLSVEVHLDRRWTGHRRFLAGLRQPGPQRGEELGQVHGLGHVVVGASVHAALPLPGHHLAGHGDDREGSARSRARIARIVS